MIKHLAVACLLSLGLVGCAGEKAVDPNQGKEGETMYLTGGKTHVPVCAVDNYEESIIARDLTASDDVRNGRILLVPNGTAVKVIHVNQGDRNYRQVQVLEGQFKSKEGCVSYKWLTPEKPSPKP